jgi:hypothetical protein
MLVCGTNEAGEKCLPVFTDTDWGERFARALGLSNPLLRQVFTHDEFLLLLDWAEEKAGCVRVTFDPKAEGDQKGVQSRQIAKVRDAVRRSRPG